MEKIVAEDFAMLLQTTTSIPPPLAAANWPLIGIKLNCWWPLLISFTNMLSIFAGHNFNTIYQFAAIVTNELYIHIASRQNFTNIKHLFLTIIASVTKKNVENIICYGALLVNYWYRHWHTQCLTNPWYGKCIYDRHLRLFKLG